MLSAIFGHFLALFGPTNLFLVPGIYFGTYDFGPVRTSVRPYVRPSVRDLFLNRETDFLKFFFNGFVLGRGKNVQSPIFEFLVFCTC